jgi:hypothetical protein
VTSVLEGIVLKKSSWGDDQNSLEPLMRLACGDVRGTTSIHTKRPRTLVLALRSYAAAETAKDRLSGDFRRRSVFDFCNTIEDKADCLVAHSDF